MGEVRCRHMKLFLQAVHEDAAGERLRSALLDDDIRLVEDSPPVAWLPVGVNVRATEVVYRVLDRAGREAFFRRLGGYDFDSTMVKSLVATALRLFGVNPVRLLGWVPRGWPQVFRDSTRIEVESLGPTHARLIDLDLPPELAGSSSWPESVAYSMTAFFTTLGRAGAVEVTETDARACRMVLDFRWA